MQQGATVSESVVYQTETGIPCAALTLDAAKSAHLAILEPAGVFYVTNATGTWTVAPISTTDKLSDANTASLALDSSGGVHVAFTTERQVRYAWSTESIWDFQTVEEISEEDEPNFNATALRIDPSGTLHLFYQYLCDGVLIHAVRNGTTWDKTHIDEVREFDHFDPGFAPQVYAFDVVIDAAGVFHYGLIVFAEMSQLIYATYDGAEWSAETLSDPNDLEEPGRMTQDLARPVDGGTVALALDSKGQAHLTFSNSDLVRCDSDCMYSNPDGEGYNRVLLPKYATNLSGEWRMKLVDAGDGRHSMGHFSRIALDPADRLHIVYDNVEDGISYFTNAYGTLQP